jgi:hypothetical protein
MTENAPLREYLEWHGRARPGHPRITAHAVLSPQMPSTRAGMTIELIMGGKQCTAGLRAF